MRISAKGMHAIRALLSMRDKPSPDASWYTMEYAIAHRGFPGVVDRIPAPAMLPRNDSEDVTVTAEVSIHDGIGMWGISAKDFVADLKSIKDVDTISVRINSPGGEVHDGVAIYNALREHPARIEVTVDGLAASAASMIAMAGDHIRMPRASQIMIHRASGCGIGTGTDCRKTAEILDLQDQTIAEIYAEKSGKRISEWMHAMDEETWYSAESAVTAGLADEVFDYPRDPQSKEDADEGTPDEHAAETTLDRLAMTAITNSALVELAKQAGFTVDLETKTLTVAETPATVAVDKAEDPTDEPQAKVPGNVEDPSDIQHSEVDELATRIKVYEYLGA